MLKVFPRWVLGAYPKFSLESADKWPKNAPIAEIFDLLLKLVCQPSALGPSIPEVTPKVFENSSGSSGWVRGGAET